TSASPSSHRAESNGHLPHSHRTEDSTVGHPVVLPRSPGNSTDDPEPIAPHPAHPAKPHSVQPRSLPSIRRPSPARPAQHPRRTPLPPHPSPPRTLPTSREQQLTPTAPAARLAPPDMLTG